MMAQLMCWYPRTTVRPSFYETWLDGRITGWAFVWLERKPILMLSARRSHTSRAICSGTSLKWEVVAIFPPMTRAWF